MVEQKATTPEQRLKAHKLKNRLNYSLVEIVIGVDPEIALLDMVTLTTLMRMESEQNLVPNLISGETGQTWLATIRQGEDEIWSIAENVLDPDQQAALRKIIRDWRANNPEMVNLTSVRFSNFAAEAAGDEVGLIVQPGGFLPEVSEATRAVDEVRRTTERAKFLAFVLPHLARLEAESLMYDLATQPEFKEWRTTIKTLSAASEKLVAVSDQLPGWFAAERQAAIDQAMDRIFAEREQFYAEVDERTVRFKELLSQIQKTLTVGDHLAGQVSETMTSVDSLVTRLELDKPSSRKDVFRIEDYRETLIEAAVTAREINNVLQSLERPLAPGLDDQARPAWSSAIQELDRHVERWILLESVAIAGLALFIAVVVVTALLVYRWALGRSRSNL